MAVRMTGSPTLSPVTSGPSASMTPVPSTPKQARRHGELGELIGGISRKVLTQTLRRLQQYGLVERHTEAPRHVEYSLTDLGRTLVEPIEVLTDWARDHGGAIADFQEAAQVA